MKKSIAVLLSAALACVSTACAAPSTASGEPPPSSSEASEEIAFALKAGTYPVEAIGHNGNFVVEVTFDGVGITDIIIGENQETGFLGTSSMDKVRSEILQYQTLNVDLVSGATVSSGALLRAVGEAVELAGGKQSDFDAEPAVPAQTYEDVTTQIVVIGSGSAGLAATVEASDLGLDVILVEQLGLLGGSSVRTGYLMAGGTDLQIAAGIENSQEDFVNYLAKRDATGVGGGNRQEIDSELFQEATAVRIGEMATDDINWLEDLGVKFNVSGYNHKGDGSRLGPFLVGALSNVLDKRGIDYRLNTRAEQIIMKENRAIGVSVEAPDGTSYTIYADGIVLATGGYNANQDMIAQYNPAYAGYPSDVCIGADGSGMKMAEVAGGVLIAMDNANYHSFAQVWRGASRSLSSIITNGAIAVNAEGKRFVNEDTYYDKSAADAITSQTGGVCYTILDQGIIDTVCVPGDNHLSNDVSMYQVGDTPQALAEKLGIDGEALAKTIADYASYVVKGADPDLGRGAASMIAPFSKGPFYGVKTAPELHTDHGGVVIDIDTHVLNAEGAVIPGLYAAGEVSASHVLGATTNTVCIAQGRIAARTIDAEIAEK